MLVGDILDCTAWQKRGAVFSPSEVEAMLWPVAAAATRQVVWVLGNHEHPPKTAMGLDVMHTTMEERPWFRSGQPSYSPEPGRAAAGGRPWGLPGSRLRPLATVGSLE